MSSFGHTEIDLVPMENSTSQVDDQMLFSGVAEKSTFYESFVSEARRKENYSNRGALKSLRSNVDND